MSEIIKRALEKQRLENPPSGLTVSELMDKLYELIDKNKVHSNAKITFELAVYATFMCENCGKLNDKGYENSILDWEVDEVNSIYSHLRLFIKARGK